MSERCVDRGGGRGRGAGVTNTMVGVGVEAVGDGEAAEAEAEAAAEGVASDRLHKLVRHELAKDRTERGEGLLGRE